MKLKFKKSNYPKHTTLVNTLIFCSVCSEIRRLVRIVLCRRIKSLWKLLKVGKNLSFSRIVKEKVNKYVVYIKKMILEAILPLDMGGVSLIEGIFRVKGSKYL